MLTYDESVQKLKASTIVSQLERHAAEIPTDIAEEVRKLSRERLDVLNELGLLDQQLQAALSGSLPQDDPESSPPVLIRKKDQLERALLDVEQKLMDKRVRLRSYERELGRGETVSREWEFDKYPEEEIRDYFEKNEDFILDKMGTVFETLADQDPQFEVKNINKFLHTKDEEDLVSEHPGVAIRDLSGVKVTVVDKRAIEQKVMEIITSNRSYRQEMIDGCVPKEAGNNFIKVFISMFFPTQRYEAGEEKRGPKVTFPKLDQYSPRTQSVVRLLSKKLFNLIDSRKELAQGPEERQRPTRKTIEPLTRKTEITGSSIDEMKVRAVIISFLSKTTDGFKNFLPPQMTMTPELETAILEVVRGINGGANNGARQWAMLHGLGGMAVMDNRKEQARLMCFYNPDKFYIRLYVGLRPVYSVVVTVDPSGEALSAPEKATPTKETDDKLAAEMMVYREAINLAKSNNMTVSELVANEELRSELLGGLKFKYRGDMNEEQQDAMFKEQITNLALPAQQPELPAVEETKIAFIKHMELLRKMSKTQ
jgi:hypothetical protein